MAIFITDEAGVFLTTEDGIFLTLDEIIFFADVRKTYTVLPRQIEFIAQAITTEFTVLPRTTEFRVNKE